MMLPSSLSSKQQQLQHHHGLLNNSSNAFFGVLLRELIVVVLVLVVYHPKVQAFVPPHAAVLRATSSSTTMRTPGRLQHHGPLFLSSSKNSANEHNEGEEEDLPNFFDDFAEMDTEGISFLASMSNNDNNTGDAPFASSKGKGGRGEIIDDQPQPLESLLKQRIQQVQQAQDEEVSRVKENWNQANWQVRGFSLDASDAKQEEEESVSNHSRNNGESVPSSTTVFEQTAPIHVCTLVVSSGGGGDGGSKWNDEEDPSVWVGRTDGSLILVRLGSEYTVRFESKLALQPSSSDDTNFSVSLTSKLVRDNWQPAFASSSDDDDDGMFGADGTAAAAAPGDEEDPFEILCQTKAYNGHSVQHIVTMDNFVFTARDDSPEIQQWLIPETTTSSNDDDDDTFALVATKVLSGVHAAPLVGLHALYLADNVDEANDNLVQQQNPDSATAAPADQSLLTSVSTDGTLAIWDVNGGDLLFSCQLCGENKNHSQDENALAAAVPITSSAAAHGHWWLGRADGKIIAYRIADLVQATADGGPCPLPIGEWQASADNVAITSLHSWGPATVRGTKSLVVVSGDAQGMVKQWDILERRASSSNNAENTVFLDAWPKMARQRLSERAHLLEGHWDTITCITRTDHSVVTASRDGTVRAWNPQTGQTTTRMDGFVEDQLSSLCLVGNHDLLLTDGNGPHVTVHDFAGADEDILKDVELDWDN